MNIPLGSKEHHELMAQFERDFRLKSPERETDPAYMRQGFLYSNGEINQQFLAYRMGYTFGRAREARE